MERGESLRNIISLKSQAGLQLWRTCDDSWGHKERLRTHQNVKILATDILSQYEQKLHKFWFHEEC